MQIRVYFVEVGPLSLNHFLQIREAMRGGKTDAFGRPPSAGHHQRWRSGAAMAVRLSLGGLGFRA